LFFAQVCSQVKLWPTFTTTTFVEFRKPAITTAYLRFKEILQSQQANFSPDKEEGLDQESKA
tara:strand:+ start:762 stop:947 length:186 start_codon:yes stop_codon:yes gene_type:complete